MVSKIGMLAATSATLQLTPPRVPAMIRVALPAAMEGSTR